MCVIGNTSDRTKVAVLSSYLAGAGDVIDEDDELHPALPLVRLIAVQHRRLNINTKNVVMSLWGATLSSQAHRSNVQWFSQDTTIL